MLLPFPRYGENMRVPPQIGICSYLTSFGHEVIWVIWSDDDCQVQQFFYNDVQVYITPQIQYFSGSSIFTKILNKILNTLRRMRFILKIFKEGKYNLIFVRDDVFDGLIAAYIKKRHKVPFVFELSNPLEMEWELYKIHNRKPRFLYYSIAKLNKFIVTRLLHKADLILPISKWLKGDLVGKGIPESKIVPVPEAVELEAFRERDREDIREKYQLGNSRVIVYIGVMGKARYPELLIRAFTKVRRERKDVKLLMVGKGYKGDVVNLQRFADNFGMKDDVIFTGWVPHSEIPNFIAAANVGVSSVPPFSFYKMSSPIKMFEYMAMGKPVVANEEIPEHKEVLEESGGGILVPFIPEAFADAIVELLDNPQRAADMGKRGREWVVNNRSYDVMAREVEKRYFEVLDREVMK
jgi:glycosyltransferase involved in cell wall biosynthesis